MANTIIIKQSSVASKVPNAGDLVSGELAINTTDEKLYTLNSSGAVAEIGHQDTPAEVLAKITQVDGSGSGLDADTLDGIDSTGFATAAQGTKADNAIPSSEKGSANGVATLDGLGLIPSTQLPAITINDTFVVASEAAMLGLTAQTGDTAVRTDLSKTFILQGTDPTLLSDWQEMLSPTDAVQSVDGRVGVVTLSDLYLGISAKAADSNLLDGLDSSQFFRLDTANTHSGNITPNITNTLNLGSTTQVYANVYATNFVGTSTSANYADLAEKYEADADYEPGTVVVFGGEKEVTISNKDSDFAIAGIISTDPAYTMNSDLDAEFVATVALRGRVPCKVTGTIKKGDLIVSGTNGRARADNTANANAVIGRALADSDGDNIIEVVVK